MRLGCLVAFFAPLVMGTAASSQDPFGEAVVIVADEPAAVAAPKAPASKVVRKPPGGAPGTPGAEAGASPADPNQKPEDKKDEGPKTVKRPDKPSRPPDPRELNVEPNPEGKIRLSFHGQAWGDVLEWLARVSAMSLDWQELPGDYLNLITQREYTVPEARDLINRHLLARGYTLLAQGEVLSLVNIQKLNPGMVPRVEPQELAKRLPHDYVKVSLPLAWMLSEKAVEELKPMLSPNAKITALKNTNRLEVIDAVANLREVYAILQREQSSDDELQRLVREFPLRYTRASDVITQLQGLLGLETKSAGSNRPATPEQMEMMQQQAMMMMQMQRQSGGQPMPSPKKDDGVHLVANARKNSVLANAPPDKMEIIAQAIKALDVESDRAQSLLTNINRMQVYRLHALDPDAFVRTLMDIGDLDPTTRLEVDTKNRAIIAYASLADHLTIRQVVERLNSSTRKFEVVQLRRLEADYVAGTIEFMMSGPKEQDSQPRYFDYYYSPSRRDDSAKKSNDMFRVDADVENNRLLLWANEVEIQEVANLLVKLGEIPAEGGSSERVRVLDVLPPEELQQLLERLRRSWPALAPNPLNLPVLPEKPAEPARTKPNLPGLLREARHGQGDHRPGEDRLAALWLASVPDVAGDSPDQRPPDDDRPIDPPQPPAPATLSPPSAATRSAGAGPFDSLRAAPPPAEQTVKPATPAVDVTITPDGRLMISSPDTQALDLLEEFIAQASPARRDYQIFKLKYASAYWVTTYLDKFFDLDAKDKSSSRSVYYYYDNYEPKKEETKFRLSRRRKLKFIDDPDTNSILVQGADSGQLATIAELLKVYDQPQQADANAARLTAVFPVSYSKAQTIADAVKDVYRDLLSSNDKALQAAANANGNPEQRGRTMAGTTYIINEGGDTNDDKERTRVSFKGKLSIGVDELTNTLIVSAEGEVLMRNVSEMIKSLDEAAKPLASVSVVQMSGKTNSAHVREVIARLLAEPKPTAKNSGANGQMLPGQPGQNQPAGVVQGEAGVVPAP